MTAARRAALLCLLLAGALMLGGCVTRSAYYAAEAWRAPEPTPPPVPRAKPAVPASAAAPAPRTLQVAASATVADASRSIIRSEALPAPGGDPEAPVAEADGVITGSYEVVRGDSIYAIARKFGVPPRAIIARNALRPPYLLAVGQVLQIPGPKIHVVSRGDTVYGISRRYGVEMAELLRVNKVASPYTISLGQKLMVPAGSLETPGGGEGARVAARAPAASGGTKSAALPAPPPRHGGKFLWPLQGTVLSSFGPRKGGQHNDGINILAPRGAPIQAADNGVVAYAGSDLRGFGKLLLIKHADGWITAYAHSESILVRRGETVRRGQTVARVGSTGNVDRPQLHFEIRKGTRAVDPAEHLAWSQSTAAN